VLNNPWDIPAPSADVIPLHRGIRMADARPREASDVSSPERLAPFRQWLDPESLRAVNDEHPDPVELYRLSLAAADNDSDAVAIICSVLGSFMLVLGAVAILAL
jgi:hypothetical protein